VIAFVTSLHRGCSHTWQCSVEDFSEQKDFLLDDDSRLSKCMTAKSCSAYGTGENKISIFTSNFLLLMSAREQSYKQSLKAKCKPGS
jgi:hypothetical protein